MWLRLPFTAVNGPFDGEANESVFVQMKQPFVLKHEYRVGNDPDAGVQLFGAFVNQFQAPSIRTLRCLRPNCTGRGRSLMKQKMYWGG